MEFLVLLLPLGDLLDRLVDVLDGGGDVVQLPHGPAVSLVVLAADTVEEPGDDGGDDDAEGADEFVGEKKMSSTTMNGAPAEPITRSSKDWSTASKSSRSNRVMLATRIPNRANPRSTSMATIRSTRPTGAAGINPASPGSPEVSDATTACLPLWSWCG